MQRRKCVCVLKSEVRNVIFFASLNIQTGKNVNVQITFFIIAKYNESGTILLTLKQICKLFEGIIIFVKMKNSKFITFAFYNKNKKIKIC